MATETLQINITADNKAAIAGISQVKNTVDGLTESIKVYQDKAFAEKDIVKLKAYNREIQALQLQLKQTTNVGKIGFDEMGVAIKNNNNGLTKAYSGLRKLAYVLPGIGMAGIFNLAFEGISYLINGLDNAKDKAKQFADEYVKAMESAEAGTQKEIASVKSLVAVASNESLSRKDRTAALKELNKEYPGYFTNVNLDLNNTEKLREITDRLSAALIRKGNAEALAGLIGKENAKIWEAQHQSLDQQIDKVDTATKIWDYFKAVVSSSDPIFAANAANTNILTDSFKQNNEVVKLAKDNIKSLTEELNKNTLEQVQNNDFVDLGTKKLKERTTEAEKLAKFLAHFRGKMLEETNASLSAPQLLPPKEKAAKENARPLPRSDSFESGMKKAKDWLQDIDNANKEALKNAAKYADVAANAFAGLFDQMKAGMNIGDALAQMFSNLAAEIAKAAIKALIFKIVLDVFSGGVSAGAEGIGFGDIFKNLLGGGGGLPKGATGGVMTGPSSGFVAILHGKENVMKPDQLGSTIHAAFNAGSMSGAGGGQHVVVLDTKLVGQDIWLSQQRTQYNRNLTT